MGAKAHLRWVTMAAAASLAVAAPAAAQQSPDPDAAPSASSTPRPDPAPAKSKPKAVVARPAPRPVAAATTTVKPAAPAATAPASTRVASKPTRRATTRRATSSRKKAAARHERRAQAPARQKVAMPRLPHLAVAALSAPSTTADAGRARKLAVGALSLLVLALASATLLAFTARVERRRVVR
jgi:hypothetical protein